MTRNWRKAGGAGLMIAGLAMTGTLFTGCGGDRAFNPAPPVFIQGTPGASGSVGGLALSSPQAIIDIVAGTPPVGTATAPTVSINNSTVTQGQTAQITVNSPVPIRRIYATLQGSNVLFGRATFVTAANGGNVLTTVTNPTISVTPGTNIPVGTYNLLFSTEDVNGVVSSVSTPLTVNVTGVG